MIVCCALALVAAGTGAPTVPAPAGIERLAVYDGTWRLTADQLATPYSKPGHTTTTIANRCTRFEQHLACGQTVDGVAEGMVVFSYDAAAKRYASLPISPDGAGHPGRLEVAGDRLIFPWDDDSSGATVHFRVTNDVLGPATIAYRKEYSTDGTTWLPIETGTERRVAR